MNQGNTAKQDKLESSSTNGTDSSRVESSSPINLNRLPIKAPSLLFYACLAIILLLAAFFYNFIVPQTPGRVVRSSFSLIPDLPIWSFITTLPFPVPQNSWIVGGALIVVTVLAFSAYGLAIVFSWYRLAQRKITTFIILTSIVFFFLSALSLPNTNTDIFNYIINGRIAAVHSSNPYLVPADEFPDDPVYPFAGKNYTGLAADKMPFWMLTNVLLARLAGNQVTTNLLIYRAALMAFNIINLLLIAIIAKKLNPHYLLSALIIYGWNPVIIVHGQSKSDTLMATLLLLAVVFLIKSWRLLAVGSLGLSVMVKLITLPLAAVYELRNLRLRQWRAFFVDLLIVGIALFMLIALFWQNSELLTRFISILGVAGVSAPGFLRIVLIIGYFLVIVAVSAVQDGSTEKLLWAWALVLLYFSLFLTKFGFSWYLITLLAIISLVFDWRIILATGALSFTSFLYNAWYSTFTTQFSPPELLNFPAYFVYIFTTILLATGLFLSVIAFQKFQQRHSDLET